MTAYLNRTLNTGLYPDPSLGINKTFFAYPIVAALGTPMTIVLNGTVTPGISGTSVSAPIVAGIFTLVNAELSRRGKALLGFVNPLLFNASAASPDIFNDITSGDNTCVGQVCLDFTEGCMVLFLMSISAEQTVCWHNWVFDSTTDVFCFLWRYDRSCLQCFAARPAIRLLRAGIQ